MNYRSFLGEELTEQQKSEGLFHIIPVPFEASVSYGHGTAGGPQAILEASQQLELWDGTGIPALRGIVTDEAVEAEKADAMVEACAAKVVEALGKGRVPIILGGEHTVSVGAFHALDQWRKETGKKIGIVQIDAHGDLRSDYRGIHMSHACVMRRAVELGFPIFQVGVRSISPEEVTFRNEQKAKRPESIGWLDAAEAVRRQVNIIPLPDAFPEHVYLTIDIDGLDPALFPSTGTPEPGGLSWYQTIDMITSLTRNRNVIGFDLVELAPVRDRNADPFGAARLIYEVMGLVERNCRPENK
jgi:agmatinase